MMPNMYLQEKAMFERVKDIQQEFEQQRLLKHVRRSRFQIIRRGAVSVGRLTGEVRARLKRVVPPYDSMAHERSGQ